MGRPSESNTLTVGQPAVGVPTGVSSTSPFAAHAHQSSFDQEPQVTVLLAALLCYCWTAGDGQLGLSFKYAVMSESCVS